MKEKILKFELILLFLVTVATSYFFYNKADLADNFLAISSKNSEFSIISYYFTSFIALVSYYTGPWILFSFLVFAVCYSLVYSRREHLFDGFHVLLNLGSFLYLAYFAMPYLVGDGLLYILEKRFSTTINISLSIFFWMSFSLVTFAGLRKPLWDFAKNNFSKLSNYSFKLISLVFLVNFVQKIALKFKNKAKGASLKMHDTLRGASKTAMTKYVPPAISEQSNYVGTEKNELEEVDEEEVQFEVEMEENSEEIEAEEVENDGQGPKVAKKKRKIVLDSQELIDCISTESRVVGNSHPDDEYFQEIISTIEEKLKEFKIDARIINILKGPVVDTFELELGQGVKVSKVNALSEDLSLALCGAPIRMVYPMKGRTTVGIEVPRNPREIIYLDEVLKSKDYSKTEMNLPIAMGKDAFGESFTVDLSSMPHMLIAGATGAGKSVFLNTLLVSLLVKKSPAEMRLILIDPKQLELVFYASLPHLDLPVITDAQTAAVALLWACQEMERRYTILKDFGVRNLENFNRKVRSADSPTLAKISHHYDDYGDSGFELPFIVIIIDEFADLILTKTGKEIETNICRLAAKARAAGIHLVLATQRPSVNVITGLIKANFPTRVSFRVTADHDSRTILNASGAEKLLGKGDMLYKNGVDMMRLHSAYVSEREIESLMEKIQSAYKSDNNYNQEALSFLDENKTREEESRISFGDANPQSLKDSDPLFQEAVNLVVEYRSASASMLQRRLNVGYNRAANLIEAMEAKGIVGPSRGAKSREVLVSGSPNP